MMGERGCFKHAGKIFELQDRKVPYGVKGRETTQLTKETKTDCLRPLSKYQKTNCL